MSELLDNPWFLLWAFFIVFCWFVSAIYWVTTTRLMKETEEIRKRRLGKCF